MKTITLQHIHQPRRAVSFLFLMALMGSVLALPSAACARNEAEMIDSCQYADDTAARAAWRPERDSSPATVDIVDGVPALRLRCPFASKQIARASWDHQVKLDLSTCRAIQFQFYCRDTTPVNYFAFYLQSGEGWYTATFYPETAGWNTITLNKAEMKIEGKPAGWDTVQTLRISAWRGGDTDTEIAVRDMKKAGELGDDTLVALLRCDSATTESPSETSSVGQFTAVVGSALERVGVSYTTLSDLSLNSETLKQARLIILPHNPTMPAQTRDELVRFVECGGRVIAFYGMPARLRSVLKIGTAGYSRSKQLGEFSAMRFVPNALPGAPAVVQQKSWNINEPKPIPGASRAIAEWLDANGRPTGHAAIVASSNGIEMAHVLLPDDPIGKSQMLLAMAGYLVPEIWRQTIDTRLAELGRINGYRDFDNACAQIIREGQGDPRVQATLAEVKTLRETAIRDSEAGRPADASRRLGDATKRLLEAFCQAQRPLEGEFRAAWCHSAFGVEGISWDEAIRNLADNGFTAVIPNMLWGGVAYYDSQVLPVAREVASQGDQIAACVAACRRYGMQVHVWKVCWNLTNAPSDFVDRMREEHRLQANSQGKEELWLCPSHPANRDLEIAAMVEVARKYDVDGVHFDYIRYPGGDYCYCDGCKARFQDALGTTIAHWPKDVLTGGPHRQAWLDWRRDNITPVVKAVSEQVRAIKPKMKISAAVFSNWLNDRDSVGQDWKLWCERGYVDFVCPMDYTDSNIQFGNLVTRQREWAGPVPCYPGIRANITRPDQVIAQIQTSRRLDTKGFTLFNYDASMAHSLLPLLGEGITRKLGIDPGSQSRPK